MAARAEALHALGQERRSVVTSAENIGTAIKSVENIEATISSAENNEAAISSSETIEVAIASAENNEAGGDSILGQILALMCITVDYVECPWIRRLKLLEQGQADVVGHFRCL